MLRPPALLLLLASSVFSLAPSTAAAELFEPWFGAGFQSVSLTGTLAAAADVNGDGRDDLITFTAVYLTQPDGQFVQSQSIAGSSLIPLVVDYDGDGDVDLIWPSVNPDTTISLHLGSGTGTFVRIPLAVGPSPGEAAVGDLNEDGYLDIAVTRINNDAITLLLGTANPNAPQRLTLMTGNAPRGVAIEDLNGDGHLDMAVTCSQSGSTSGGYLSFHFGDGTGSFAPRVDQSTTRVGYRIQSHDFSGDGNADLMFKDQYYTVSYLVNQGGGNFYPSVDYYGAYWVESADLYPDDAWEFVVLPHQPTGHYPSWGGAGIGIFNDGGLADVSVALPGGTHIVCGDINGDGHRDVLTSSTGWVHFFPHPVLGPWQHPDYRALPISLDFNGGMCFSDLNGDGRLDIAAGNVQGFEVAYAAPSGGFILYPDPPGRAFEGDVSIGDPAAADLNGDGFADLVIATSTYCGYHCYRKGIRIGWVSASGVLSYSSEINFTAYTVATGDANGDGLSDVIGVVQDAVSGFYLVSVLPGDGIGGFGAEIRSLLTEGQSSYGPLAVGDLNGDGVLDVVTGNGAHLGLGLGLFGSLIGWETPVVDYDEVILADLNWDGVLDAVGSGPYNGPVTTRLGRGDGSFQLGTQFPGLTTSSLAAADLNGDGYAELALGNNPTRVFLGSASGAYTLEGAYGGTYDGIALADVTGDGLLDLLSPHGYAPNLKPIVDVFPPAVSIEQPNGGGVFASEHPLSIEWSAKDGVGVQNVDLFLVLEGQPDQLIAEQLPAAGSLEWTPGASNTGTAKVRAVVTDLSGNSAVDESDTPFSIMGPPVDVPDATIAPLKLALRVSPNPFVGSARVDLDLPGPTPVRVTVNDVGGRLVEVLEDGFVSNPNQSFVWRPRTAAPGVYFVRIATRFGTLTRRIALLP